MWRDKVGQGLTLMIDYWTYLPCGSVRLIDEFTSFMGVTNLLNLSCGKGIMNTRTPLGSN